MGLRHLEAPAGLKKQTRGHEGISSVHASAFRSGSRPRYLSNKATPFFFFFQQTSSSGCLESSHQPPGAMRCCFFAAACTWPLLIGIYSTILSHSHISRVLSAGKKHPHLLKMSFAKHDMLRQAARPVRLSLYLLCPTTPPSPPRPCLQRSYSAPSAPSRSYAPSYGGGSTTVIPVPVPMGGYGMGYGYGSPFGFSPFGRPGVSFYGGGFGVNPVDLLVLGGVAYGVSQLVKVRNA